MYSLRPSDLPRNSGGHDMCAEKRRDDFQRLRGAQFLVQRKNFQFARDIEPVAALCFDRCRAIRRKFLQRRPCPPLSNCELVAARSFFTEFRIPPPLRAISS